MLTRREFLLGSAFLLAAPEMPVSFYDAQKDERKRPSHLRQLKSRFQLEKASGVSYGITQRNIENFLLPYAGILRWTEKELKDTIARDIDPDAYAVTPTLMNLVGRRIKFPILVGPKAYARCESEDDFLSVVVDHEYEHVCAAFGGIRVGDFTLDYTNFAGYDREFIKSIYELLGYEHELLQIATRNRKVSRTVEKNTLDGYYKNFKQAREAAEKDFSCGIIFRKYLSASRIVVRKNGSKINIAVK